jgi:DNA-binding CsgD family transcriptional regulator
MTEMTRGTINSTRPACPDDLVLLSIIPGIAAHIYDDNQSVIWCTDATIDLLKNYASKDEFLGTSISDHEHEIDIPRVQHIHQDVIQYGLPVRCISVGSCGRMVRTFYPIDETQFGHTGTLVFMSVEREDKPKPTTRCTVPTTSKGMAQILSLSPNELRVLHQVARGMPPKSIADHLCWSLATIRKLTRHIHFKLGTTSRDELVEFAQANGLLSFTDADWARVVDGSMTYRREQTHDLKIRPA